MKQHSLVLILLMTLSAGCTAQPVGHIETPAVTLGQDHPTATLTQTLEMTSTMTFTPTITPSPTVSVEDALAWLDEYYSREDACKFTCWLGITPGVTTFAEAQAILQPVAIRIEPVQTDHDGKLYYVTLPDWQNENHSASIYVRNDQVVGAIYTGIETSNIQEFLGWASEPDDVWVYFARIRQTGDILFFLMSISTEGGYAVIYFNEFAPWVATSDGMAVKICTSTLFMNPPALIMWAPNGDFSASKIINHLFHDDVPLFKELESVSDLSAGDFYERFRSVDEDACMEIPYVGW